eukprot:Colp12_sorted_trinity150504_noHs@27081
MDQISVAVFLALVLPCLVLCYSFFKRRRDLKGEIVVITGAANGLGRLMSIDLAKKGASLVLWDVDAENLKQTAELVRKEGGKCMHIVVDVGDVEKVKHAAKQAREEFGDITILINNAGVVSARSILELSEEQIMRTFRVNTLSHFWTVREFLPAMLKANNGYIVTMASILSYMTFSGLSDYTASKAAVANLHETLSMELSGTNVKTLVVCPATMRTRMFSGVPEMPMFSSLEPEYVSRRVVGALLAGRSGIMLLPRIFYTLPIYRSLPTKLRVFLADITGANTAIQKMNESRKQKN